MTDKEVKGVEWKSAGAMDAEAVAKHRARVGKQFTSPATAGLNTEATKDTIRHFADGIGDPNVSQDFKDAVEALISFS